MGRACCRVEESWPRMTPCSASTAPSREARQRGAQRGRKLRILQKNTTYKNTATVEPAGTPFFPVTAYIRCEQVQEHRARDSSPRLACLLSTENKVSCTPQLPSPTDASRTLPAPGPTSGTAEAPPPSPLPRALPSRRPLLTPRFSDLGSSSQNHQVLSRIPDSGFWILG